MKRKMFGILPLIIGGGLILSGCVHTHHAVVTTETTTGPATTTQTTRTVVVTQAPPPPRTEVMGTPPSEAQVWVGGYWSFTNGRWVWMPGHWELRPRAGAVWVPGHWDRNPEGTGWAWTEGY